MLHRLLLAGCVSTVMIVAGCQPTPRSDPRKTLRLSMGPPESPFLQLGNALIEASQSILPDIDMTLQPSTGVVNNLEALQQGEADIGIAFADMAYFAFVGRLGRGSKPFDHLRGIAVLPVVPINLFVRTDAGVRDVPGLRGRRVRVGDIDAGRSNSLAGLIVLKAFGIEPDRIHAAFMPVAEAAAAMADRSLDAVFVIGYPPAFRPLIGKVARLLPLAGAATDRLRREYPFFRPMKIPEGVYPGGAIQTLGVERLLVCRSELDTDLIYRFTKTFFEVLPVLASQFESVASTSVELAPATPIPLHDGALRYYREREVSR